jgi:RNA polymerase sigma factor (TIGR02999 family)
MATQDITLMLKAWGEGDREALERLTAIVYEELHRLAHRQLRRERPGHLLQTSALVNEAWLRLIDAERIDFQNRAHFFGVSAQLMRQILVDFARSRQSQKRGGQLAQVSLSEAAELGEERPTDLVALDDALTALEKLAPRQARTVELRFFGGLSWEETAAVLQVSVGTVRRDWRLAQAWLHQQLSAAL